MMAINVYLTVFKNYNASDLKRLELRYFSICYGLPFIVGFVLCFCSSSSRGKIYGPADLWCWISSEWNFLRVILCYGPIWYVYPSSFIPMLTSPQDLYRCRILHLRSCWAANISQTETTPSVPGLSTGSGRGHYSGARREASKQQRTHLERGDGIWRARPVPQLASTSPKEPGRQATKGLRAIQCLHRARFHQSEYRAASAAAGHRHKQSAPQPHRRSCCEQSCMGLHKMRHSVLRLPNHHLGMCNPPLSLPSTLSLSSQA